MITLTSDKRMLGFASFEACPNISHFVTTRLGGVSTGSYGSFNCSPFTNDAPEHIRENTALLLDGMQQKPDVLLIPHQVHRTEILHIDRPFLDLAETERRERLEGVDALITDQPGCCIVVSTADCIPVMLYDPQHQAIAVAHAGWRGTVAFIVAKTIERMQQCYHTDPHCLKACIGPGISLESFEVGEEVYDAFQAAGFPMHELAVRYEPAGKWHIDLWKANQWQLLEAGVPASQIEISGICTYQHPDLFFSARRLGIDSGRILSGIMLNK